MLHKGALIFRPSRKPSIPASLERAVLMDQYETGRSRGGKIEPTASEP